MDFTKAAIKVGSNKKGDLQVTLELTGRVRKIEIHSKVEQKFGEAIKKDVEKMLDKYKIQGVKVLVEDLGALGFAVKARTETAIKRALLGKGAK